MTAHLDPQRLRVVAAQADRWRNLLIDVSPSNTMLVFKNTKTGSLDLTGAEPEPLATVAGGGKATLRTLFPDAVRHQAACTSAQSLARRIQLFDEEQGVEVGRLALGFVLTDAQQHKGSRPVPTLRAPLLLRPMTVRPRTAAESDFSVETGEDVEVNPVLLYVLDQYYGVAVVRDEFTAHVEHVLGTVEGHAAQAEAVFGELARIAAAQNVGLKLENSAMLGAFNYVKLPMVEDLASATELLAGHDLIAAIAGYTPAAGELGGDQGAFQPQPVDQVRPADEFLVQDADSSQHRAIMTALAGRHLFIEGPPGTGKSQTIANIIAGAAATGRKVLFVAEKRAAIEAVVNRLADVRLEGLVLDLHQQKISKRDVARQLANSLDAVSKQPPVEVDRLHARLSGARQYLLRHAAALHDIREPWGVSAYQIRDRLLDLPANGAISGAFRGAQLAALDRQVVIELEQELREFFELGGGRLLRRETPWCNAEVRTTNDARRVLYELDELAEGTLKRGQAGMGALLRQTGLNQPRDIAGWQDVLSLLDQVSLSVRDFGPDIFGTHLDPFCHATADRATRARHPRQLPWKQRRALVKQVRAMSRQGLKKKAELHVRLIGIAGQRQRWYELGGHQTQPAHVTGLKEVMADYAELRRQLAAVALSARRPDLENGSGPDVERRLGELRGDKQTLFRMPRLTELRDRFHSLGLGHVVQEMADKRLGPDAVWPAFEHLWLSSIEDELKLTVPELGQFVTERQTRAAQDFRAADIEHRETSAARVRRAVARQVKEAKDRHPDQAQVLKKQASLKSRHMPTRKLVEQASDVLMALRPCWAMSPLIVSRMLPAQRLFDLVIFDEASQIRPHDAITSIMRGDRLVVAGDEKQLPPSTFFDRALADEDEDEEFAAELSDFESILTALRPVMPNTQMLSWHYRSSDERLISFSNREIYRDGLVTFPGARKESPVTLESVHGEASPGQHGSSPAEVERVVDLVLRHAMQRPEESLGVITSSMKHQARIERALREARKAHPELDDFFSSEAELGRRFFVKNLENVQGDERDAIILSVGIARNLAGKIDLRSFGPLNQQGGERRLNVAVTRAKRRMTVVSSFTAMDLAPSERVTGTELLRRYLDFAERQGSLDTIGRQETQELNGFERAIAHALGERGVPVYPQWGFSGYRIDFALAHRDDPGRMVLAVEADGMRYHSSLSARDRDRLRQTHLETLGWRFHRLWSSAWFADPAGETDRIVAAWEKAMADADVAGPAEMRAADPLPRAAPAPPVIRREPRPNVPSGLRIQDYSERQLVQVCRWLMTDGLLLDKDERLQEAMTELGFRRRGSLIVERLGRAVGRAQQLADNGEEL
ncbi:AAA domain-containing protein [Amycolatopsis sp.]|uniref:AAA domain-containing protein n=1 Tax=Amycolatopsis sp. TaxID=37632 RepID=UPI002CBE4C8E|nr:AAA domain-containing protein [Amycolatopsis sp.]HVV11321.1 AAA domain-containing protein [Amycolatopsis sp.]